MNHKATLEAVLGICRQAGDAIMNVYGSEFRVDYKDDRSPLTEADQQAHGIIVAGLAELTPDIPVLSEESPPRAFEKRRSWDTFWLVDPLDGTKEFVKRNDEFTVNVALIEGRRAILGVVRAPVLETDYYGAVEHGAWRRQAGRDVRIRVTTPSSHPPRVVGSRSHRGASLDKFLDALGDYQLIPMGSSLKICLVAAGQADIYPRLGPTSEWDTAAAQAVLESAGGYMMDLTGRRLDYNKADILNPHFLAYGDGARDWRSLIKD